MIRFPDSRAVLMTSWFASAESAPGWTALPRLALWLCAPALIAGMAGAASQINRTLLPSTAPVAAAVGRSAGSVAVLFGVLAMALTPIAAVLVLVLSLLRRWPFRVIGVLWLAVIGAMAMTLPATDVAVRNWMVRAGVVEQR